ncbi:MAG: hypothetical protein Q9207_006653 [Kuettlingeria erythrocarpa]
MAARSSRFGARAQSVPTSDMIKLEINDEDHKSQDAPAEESTTRFPNVPNVQYPGLKSASKRKRADVTDSKSDVEPEARSKTLKSSHRPYAPPEYRRNRRASTGNKRTVNTRLTKHGADWYHETNMLDVYNRAELNTLKYARELIANCVRAIETGVDKEVQFSILRRRFHQMEFYDFVTEILVVRSKLFEDDGFAAVFDNASFPSDLRADALMLFKRWARRRWDPDLLRGIVTKRGTNDKEQTFNSKSLDKDYPHKLAANYRGAGDLVNGQWWPLQICTIRDGAHGMAEGGIYGQVKRGVYSIILSGGGYADIDEGDIIQYCGTSGEENKPTAFTERMLESAALKEPVRVLRSASGGFVNKQVLFRPVKGLRYDGLYKITGYELLHQGTAMYRFTLERCPNQDPIRYRGPEARPTDEELSAYRKIESLLKTSG